MAGEIYLSNLSGQFDYQAILQKYQELKFQQVSLIRQKESAVQQKKSAFETFATSLEDFKKSFDALTDTTLLDKKNVTVSDETVATATINNASVVNPADLHFTVNQLASNDVWLSQAGVANKSDSVASTDGTLTISVGGTDYAIDYTSTDTLQDIANKINQASNNVQASIFYDGSNYRLIVSSAKTGTDNTLSFSDTGDLLDTLQLGDSYSDSHVQNAQNAQISIYGETVESQTNTFTNLLSGIDITVKQVSSDPVEIKVENDNEAVKNSLSDFISKYNSLVDTIADLTGKGKPLSGDFTLQSIRSTIFDNLTPLFDAELLSVDYKTGHLSLNSDNLDNLLQNDRNTLKSTFTSLKDGLSTYMDYLFDTDGLIRGKEKNYDTQIEKYEEYIQDQTKRINKEIENLKKQFIHLDMQMAQFNDIKTRLSAILPKKNT